VIDVWSYLFPNSNSGTTCNNGTDNEKRIDYIFIHPDISAEDMRLGEKISGICPSDHLAITADLLIPLGGSEFVE
jgi:endonuclease/exonuclease/phosphatase family metal-dependent hydrolase